jgi:Flagellar P-ring protein
MPRSMGALGLCVLLLTGCLPDEQKRLQMAEANEKERDLDVRTVKDVCDVGNLGPLQVHGIGLVTGLAGTGHSPDGYYRKMMEQFLLKNMGHRGGQMANVPKESNVRQILDNPNNCLVIVSAFIPAGTRKGDRFDVDVTLPDGSKAESLAGGYLEFSLLRMYERAANLSDKYKDSRQLLAGNIFAHAKGQLIVGFGSNVDANELKKGKVWNGAASRIDRPYSLLMRNDGKSVKIANDVAVRINFMYQDDPRSRALHADFSNEENLILNLGNVANQINQTQDPNGMNQGEMAKAVNKEVINMRVPFVYRYDHQRFLHVATFTPLSRTDPNLTNYRQRLQKMLLDPRETWRAARRLEALGRDSVSILKTGLESEHPFVRFCAAEALAYLSSTAGVDALAQLATQHPLLAKPCTIALANLGESICKDKLVELLASDEPALRCAVFHALSLLDEHDPHPRLGGQFLNETFWLYRVPQSPNSMVYFSTSKRAQVVLFGRNIVIAPDTRMMIGKDYTLAPHDRDGLFLVKRITAQGEQKRLSSNRLDELLTALTELGAAYPDIVAFLRKATDYQCVNCPIVNWTIPDVRLETLVSAGPNLK